MFYLIELLYLNEISHKVSEQLAKFFSREKINFLLNINKKRKISYKILHV